MTLWITQNSATVSQAECEGKKKRAPEKIKLARITLPGEDDSVCKCFIPNQGQGLDKALMGNLLSLKRSLSHHSNWKLVLFSLLCLC
jgi:hypothetical protein